jgi:hypothetical protein
LPNVTPLPSFLTGGRPENGKASTSDLNTAILQAVSVCYSSTQRMPRGANWLSVAGSLSVKRTISFLLRFSSSCASDSHQWPALAEMRRSNLRHHTECFHQARSRRKQMEGLQNLHRSNSNTRLPFLETTTSNSESNRSRHSILLLEFLY